MTPSIQLSVPSTAQRLSVGNDPGTLGDETTPEQSNNGRQVPKRRQDTKNRYKILMAIVDKRTNRRLQTIKSEPKMTNTKNSAAIESIVDEIFNGDFVDEGTKHDGDIIRYPNGDVKMMVDGKPERIKHDTFHGYLQNVIRKQGPTVNSEGDSAGDVIAHLAAAAAVHHAHNIMQAHSEFEKRDKVGASTAPINRYWGKHVQAIPHLYKSLARHHGQEVNKDYLKSLREGNTINHTSDSPSGTTIKSVADATNASIEMGKLASAANKDGKAHPSIVLPRVIQHALHDYDPHDPAKVAKLLAAHRIHYGEDSKVPHHMAVKEALSKLTGRSKLSGKKEERTPYPGTVDAVKSLSHAVPSDKKSELTKLRSEITEPGEFVTPSTGKKVSDEKKPSDKGKGWFTHEGNHELDQDVSDKAWKVNPEWDPKKPHDTAYAIRTGADQGRNTKHAYTVEHNNQSHNKKFDTVARVAKIWPSVASEFKKHAFADTEHGLHSFIAHIIATTKGRIGSSGNVKDESYGISTLQRRHFEDRGKKPKLSYAGKKGVINTHEFDESDPDQKAIVDHLRKLAANKGPDESLFTIKHPDGKETRASEHGVNKLIHSVVGREHGKFTAHKVRSLYATTHMHHELNFGKGAPKVGEATPEQVHAHYHNVLEKVAAMLHHKHKRTKQNEVSSPTTTHSYIDPRITQAYFKKHGVEAPKEIQEILKKRSPGNLPASHGYKDIKESLMGTPVSTGNPFLDLHNEYVSLGILPDINSPPEYEGGESVIESAVSWWYDGE